MTAVYVASSSAASNGFEPSRPAGYDATYPSAGTWGPNSIVVFFAIWYDDAASTFTAPTPGFTQPGGNAKRIASHTNVIVCEMAYKIAGASEPTTYNGSGTAEADYNNSAVVIVNSADTTTPYDVASGNSGQSATVTWTGVTPARNDSLAIALHCGYNSPAGAIGGTPTMTERINALDGVNDLYTATYATSDTGNRTATVTSDTWAALLIIIQPPSGGGGGGGTLAARKSLLGVGLNRPRRDEWERPKHGRIYTRRAA